MRLSVLRNPSAWIPLAMSAAAVPLIVAHVALVGTARQADEGLEAHLCQLLMAGQLPIVVFVAISWLPRRPVQALLVLALQLAAGLAAVAPNSRPRLVNARERMVST
jgi:uncharacterized membrane protein